MLSNNDYSTDYRFYPRRARRDIAERYASSATARLMRVLPWRRLIGGTTLLLALSNDGPC